MSIARKLLAALATAVILVGCTNTPSSPPSSSAVEGTPGPPGTPVPGSTQPGSVDPGQPNPEPASPTSADLIQAAVDAGTLDDATGLLYRVFATFGDPRLPAAYATGRLDEDVVALLRGPAEMDSLPPGVADQLRPFFVRPTDPASPFYAPADDATAAGATVQLAAFQRPVTRAGQPPAAAVSCDPDTHWGSAPGSTWIRVWSRCDVPGYELDILQTIAAADAIYRDESAYLGGALPVEDSGGEAQGGDTRIDIYLTPDCVPRSPGSGAGPTARPTCLGGDDGYTPGSSEFRTRGGAEACSAFVLINRSRLASPDKLRDTLAHELFHVFEYSFNYSGFLGASGARWFLEASATWAEWRFAHAVPVDSHGTHVFNAFQGSFVSLQSDASGNGYLSFGWPLFMEQQGGAGTVAAAWSAIAGKGDATAIMAAINGALPFEANFRIFGMRGWNHDITIDSPVTPWLPAEPVSVGSTRAIPYNDKGPASIELKGTDKGATPRSYPGDLPSLYARYRPFTVADDVGQIILDFSGLKPADRLDVDALVKLRGENEWKREELPDTKKTWCTDNPKEDVEEFVIVLSDHARALGEDVSGTWTVDTPKEPCLSYHIVIKWTEIFDGVPDPFVFDGYADTINPDALGGQVMLIGSGTYSGSRLGYIGCNPGLEGVLPGHGAGTATFQAVIVGDVVTVNAFSDFQSTFAGVSTWPVEGPRGGTFDASMGAETPVETSGPSVGDLCPRAWSISATWEIQIKPPP